ncbi:MAG: hypothetical protein ACK55X_11640 [Synechococcaceae cyanobacterium]|jgi:hypothetical protein
MLHTENQLRDHLFENYKESFHRLIRGRREPISWAKEEFPPISILLQQIVETRINSIVAGLESLVLSARELRLERTGDSTTRIDLFGNSECIGLTIIELKKSKQTERQAFTELLAYSNHFCSIFPGLTEKAINTVLVAPMESRTVRDAYVQEVLGNGKSSLALVPREENSKINLEIYYPDASYYQWFENNLLDDRSMYVVAIEFEEVKGWIDIDVENGGQIPEYSKSALNTISSAISHRLEAQGFHSLVYATQQWGEIGQIFPYPNAIYAVFVNPFASFRGSCHEGEIFGETREGRVTEIQAIYDQLDEHEKDLWLESMESGFHDFAIRAVKDEFDKCFLNRHGKSVRCEISLPDWYGVKTSMISSVFTHNLDIFQTGLLRDIYSRYVSHMFEMKEGLYYHDDLPMYSYGTLRAFLPVWEILRGLGVGDDHA